MNQERSLNREIRDKAKAFVISAVRFHLTTVPMSKYAAGALTTEEANEFKIELELFLDRLRCDILIIDCEEEAKNPLAD